jgi:OPA family sugar phosphate sensor protein UhpC-like MFS transporter
LPAAGDPRRAVLCWRLRDRPQAVGLPAVGDWRHDELEIAQQQEGPG